MGRIRSIHPSACVSETLAKLTSCQERTFWRLLTHCDDKGRAAMNILLIKAACYPLHMEMTHEAILKDLHALAAAGLIRFYNVDGRDYLHVSSWDEFQHPKNPTPSKLPAPPDGPSPVLPQDLPSPSPGVPQPLPMPNPRVPLGEERRGEELPPYPPLGGGKRKSKTERLAPFRQDVVTMVLRLLEQWPTERADGSRLDNDPVDAASNVERILGKHPEITLAALESAAVAWIEAGKPFPNAIQFWFGPGKRDGPEPPWRKGVRALIPQQVPA